MFEKVENVKRPLKKGEKFLVPCIIREERGKLYITPVINHPHNDKENGQDEIHYHADYRFIRYQEIGNFIVVVNKHSKHIFCESNRAHTGIDGHIEYFVLPVINEGFSAITPVEFISKSRLKHKCIHKGKCPHRGYDLSQVNPVNGVITCPLHGLKFDADTKKLIN